MSKSKSIFEHPMEKTYEYRTFDDYWASLPSTIKDKVENSDLKRTLRMAFEYGRRTKLVERN
jgi:hypothetical protein